jgi:hypothetical protein
MCNACGVLAGMRDGIWGGLVLRRIGSHVQRLQAGCRVKLARFTHCFDRRRVLAPEKYSAQKSRPCFHGRLWQQC